MDTADITRTVHILGDKASVILVAAKKIVLTSGD